MIDCKTEGHCIHPDDTTNTCQRCGAVDGWIKHTGNECPVDGETVVEILCRGHTTVKPVKKNHYHKAESYSWFQHGSKSDITHYRIVSEPKTHPAAGLEPMVSVPSVDAIRGLKKEEMWDPYSDRNDNNCYWNGWNAAIDAVLALTTKE